MVVIDPRASCRAHGDRRLRNAGLNCVLHGVLAAVNTRHPMSQSVQRRQSAGRPYPLPVTSPQLCCTINLATPPSGASGTQPAGIQRHDASCCVHSSPPHHLHEWSEYVSVVAKVRRLREPGTHQPPDIHEPTAQKRAQRNVKVSHLAWGCNREAENWRADRLTPRARLTRRAAQ